MIDIYIFSFQFAWKKLKQNLSPLWKISYSSISINNKKNEIASRSILENVMKQTFQYFYHNFHASKFKIDPLTPFTSRV